MIEIAVRQNGKPAKMALGIVHKLHDIVVYMLTASVTGGFVYISTDEQTNPFRIEQFNARPPTYLRDDCAQRQLYRLADQPRANPCTLICPAKTSLAPKQQAGGSWSKSTTGVQRRQGFGDVSVRH